jgi:hypothetical protein
MSDAAIFVFGLVATLFTLGPLIIAAISEVRGKDHQNQESFLDRDNGDK